MIKLKKEEVNFPFQSPPSQTFEIEPLALGYNRICTEKHIYDKKMK